LIPGHEYETGMPTTKIPQLDMRLNDQYNAIGTTNTNTVSGSHVAFPPSLAIAHITLNPVKLSFK